MAKSTPWRDAMLALLADGEPHVKEDVIAAGMVVVPAERALQEMRDRSPHSTEALRIERGQRTVAQQALSGLVRFKNVKVDRKDMVTLIGEDSFSDGQLLAMLLRHEEEIQELKARNSLLEQRLGLPLVPDSKVNVDEVLTQPGAAVLNLFAKRGE